MSSIKIGLPDGQPDRGNKKNTSNPKKSNTNKPNKVHKPKAKSKPKKVDPENIRWRDNGDTFSARIGNQIIHISKKNFNIQLKNGFVINCKDLDDAKNKAILLFNT